MNPNLIRLSIRTAHWTVLLGVTAGHALAPIEFVWAGNAGCRKQNDGIAKWVGITLCNICGIDHWAALVAMRPNIFMVLNQVRRQKILYDPMKRDWFQLWVERPSE